MKAPALVRAPTKADRERRDRMGRSRPHIYFERGYWRVTLMPRNSKSLPGGRTPWVRAHEVTTRLNKALHVQRQRALIVTTQRVPGDPGVSVFDLLNGR